MAKSYSIAEVVKAIATEDKATLMILGKRIPLTLCMLISASKSEDANKFLNVLDFVSTRKIEMMLRGDIKEPEDDDIEDPVAKAEEKKEEKTTRRGRKSAEKKEEAKPAKKSTKAMNEPEEEEDPDYESMSEVELFKVCKAKGLKPAPKQKKEYYLDLLNPSEAEDDDWEEEEKPSKKAPAKKTTSKKKATEDEDDDDWDI